MKTYKVLTTLGIAVLLAACSANQEVVSIDEYDDLYYSGDRNSQIVYLPQTEMASAYSGTGSSAEMSYYQNQPYDYGVDPVQATGNNQSMNNQDSSTPPAAVYSEDDYYDADYAADYNNFHTVGVGSDFATQNSAPNMNMSLGFNSFGGNSMWGMGMSYGSPMWGSPWMGNSMGMGMGMGMGGFCPPFGSPFYDPWCNPWGWNSPFAGPAWRWGWSANFGWGGNPWMNPYCMSGMGNPWMSPFGPYGYDPYGFNQYGYNPYGPIYYSPNPWDGGNSQSGNSDVSNNGRTQRGGVITAPSGQGAGTDDGKRVINEAGTGNSTNVRSGASRSIAPNTSGNSEASGQDVFRQGSNTQSTAPSSRINRNNLDAEQNTKGQENRNRQVLSPYVRQQSTKSPTEGGNINRGSAPRSQPSRQHYNQPSYSPSSNIPSNSPSPSYTPQRSGGSSGGNSGGGGSVSPTRRR
jgi:hypothetical protein